MLIHKIILEIILYNSYRFSNKAILFCLSEISFYFFEILIWFNATIAATITAIDEIMVDATSAQVGVAIVSAAFSIAKRIYSKL